MEVIEVEGATGNYHTNYDGKAQAAISAYKDGADFVYIHVEAPDECGHRGEVENKVHSIEKIDQQILRPVYEYLQDSEEPFKILVLPDHPTPIALRTHTSEYVPFFLFDSTNARSGAPVFSEENARQCDTVIHDGSTLLDLMIKGV